MKYIKGIISVLVLLISLQMVMGAADFQVASFSCTPAEVVVNDVFSCTAQMQNAGDAAGSVSLATLYTDANDWLENPSYAQASGTSTDPGQSAEVSFIGLRAIKTGNSGFSKIMLDDVTDSYVTDVDVNVIDVISIVTNTAASAAMGGTLETTVDVTTGGNTDVTLTWTANSGGCTIPNQAATKTITGMTDGSQQSRSWTITQGLTGACRFTILASATGNAGDATTSDSTTNSITCSDCPTDDDDDSSTTSSGSGGGGGGAGGFTSDEEEEEEEIAEGVEDDAGEEEEQSLIDEILERAAEFIEDIQESFKEYGWLWAILGALVIIGVVVYFTTRKK